MKEFKAEPLPNVEQLSIWGIFEKFMIYEVVGISGVLSTCVWRQGQHIHKLESQQIKSLTLHDINSDGLADIVVEQNSGDKIVYYSDGNDVYLTAEQMKQREIDKIEAGYREQLRKTDEFHKRAYDGNNIGGRE